MSTHFVFEISNIDLFINLIKFINEKNKDGGLFKYTNQYSSNLSYVKKNNSVYRRSVTSMGTFMYDNLLTYNKLILNETKVEKNIVSVFEVNIDMKISYMVYGETGNKYLIEFVFGKRLFKPSNFNESLALNMFKHIRSIPDLFDENKKMDLRNKCTYYNMTIQQLNNNLTNKALKEDVDNILKNNVGPAITSTYYQNHLIQAYIYLSASFIFKDDDTSEKIKLLNYKSKSGMKSLVNNVVGLSATNYATDVLPFIENYYITEKTDGVRAFCFIFDNKHSVIISNKIYFPDVKSLEDIKNINDLELINKYKKITIFDCELIIKDESVLECDSKGRYILKHSNYELKLFDILVNENLSVANKPFSDRITILKKYVHMGGKMVGTVKKFVKLSRKNHNTEIIDFYNTVKDKNIDGLIFTPEGPNSQHKSHLNNRVVNENYSSMVPYKWKKFEDTTIDFYIASIPKELIKDKNACGDECYAYALCSGINGHQMANYKLRYIENYADIIPQKYHRLNYFPVPFYTLNNPTLYLFYSKDSSLHDKIGEFNYINNQWNLTKIRTDRDNELARGEYYGNNYKIALDTWHMLQYPLTIEMMGNDKLVYDNNYFKVHNNSVYEEQRKYNSYAKNEVLSSVKNELLNKKINLNWIIDLACGKGQDLYKINKLEFKNVLFIDKDHMAIGELIRRINSSRTKSKIYNECMDLTTNYKTVLEKIDYVKSESADLIVCNFALHYFTDKLETIENLSQLINHLLSLHGKVVFTCFDGKKVFNLLSNVERVDYHENSTVKYSIIKEYNNSKIKSFGQKIKVLLPFSGQDEYYEEYLVNIDSIENEFNKKNIILSKQGSFSEFMNKYSKVHLLTENDKSYIDLYHYYIFERDTDMLKEE